MSKYEEMSDTDINKLVAEKLGLYVADNIFMADYCNNPLGAWPIILENKINIAFAASSDESQASAGFYCCMDKNPLRAAMIVYLMMEDEA